jgi:chorismate-pyruvate lyase
MSSSPPTLTRHTLLYPLDEFYGRRSLALPVVMPVAGPDVPEPYRGLLVHDHDMTPTLEAFHGETIHLRVIERQLEDDRLARQVVLTLDRSGRPVEYGAIVIHTRQFPEEARALLLESRVPLGTLLHRFAIAHSSRPQAFLRIDSDALINEALGLAGPQVLFGRRNVLLTPTDQVLAEIVEILPPAR